VSSDGEIRISVRWIDLERTLVEITRHVGFEVRVGVETLHDEKHRGPVSRVTIVDLLGDAHGFGAQ
jgi:hypothetical protein